MASSVLRAVQCWSSSNILQVVPSDYRPCAQVMIAAGWWQDTTYPRRRLAAPQPRSSAPKQLGQRSDWQQRSGNSNNIRYKAWNGNRHHSSNSLPCASAMRVAVEQGSGGAPVAAGSGSAATAGSWTHFALQQSILSTHTAGQCCCPTHARVAFCSRRPVALHSVAAQLHAAFANSPTIYALISRQDSF